MKKIVVLILLLTLVTIGGCINSGLPSPNEIEGMDEGEILNLQLDGIEEEQGTDEDIDLGEVF